MFKSVVFFSVSRCGRAKRAGRERSEVMGQGKASVASPACSVRGKKEEKERRKGGRGGRGEVARREARYSPGKGERSERDASVAR